MRDAADRSADRRRLVDALIRTGLWNAEPPTDTDARPFDTDIAVQVHRFLARAPSRLMLVQLEDVTRAEEMMNLPGTVDQHPNWRRRLTGSGERMFDDPARAADPRCRGRGAAIARVRGRGGDWGRLRPGGRPIRPRGPWRDPRGMRGAGIGLGCVAPAGGGAGGRIPVGRRGPAPPAGTRTGRVIGTGSLPRRRFLFIAARQCVRVRPVPPCRIEAAGSRAHGTGSLPEREGRFRSGCAEWGGFGSVIPSTSGGRIRLKRVKPTRSLKRLLKSRLAMVPPHAAVPPLPGIKAGGGTLIMTRSGTMMTSESTDDMDRISPRGERRGRMSATTGIS